MSTITAQEPVTIVIDPAIKDNEDAFNFWKEKLPPALLKRAEDIKITLKYRCYKKDKTLLEMIFMLKPKETKEFTSEDPVGLVFFEKGNPANDSFLDGSSLAMGMSGRDEYNFLKQQPLNEKNKTIFGKYFLFPDRRSFNGVEIACSDIISITYIETKD